MECCTFGFGCGIVSLAESGGSLFLPGLDMRYVWEVVALLLSVVWVGGLG